MIRRQDRAREEIIYGPNRRIYAPHLDVYYKSEFL